ncbi:hypothetical protein [Umezawaea sp. NPDC059074]|uniref:hypothetical protein n=1 Tax=Umezawaea sp. NPDC059074 TaxID=3346716 RepID=UPI003690A4D6
MAARGEAQADVEVSTLVVPAWRLRWRAPELALVLGERAVALASTRRDEVDRLRAESLVIFASNRMGRGVRIADRALDALRASDKAGEQETSWRLRNELACATAVGAPLTTGFGAVRPVLAAEGVPNALRAAALVQAGDCLVTIGRGPQLAMALSEADQLYVSDTLLDADTRLLQRGLLHASAAAQHRRWGDLQAATDAAGKGLELLAELGDPTVDSGQVRARLTLELVCALMDSNRLGEASEIGSPLLDLPVRAPSAGDVGWLRLALATRVHLPAGRVDIARGMLRDAADSAQRHQLDTLLAESLLALAHVHEVSGDLAEALTDLRSAHAAERRRARAVYAVRARLAAEFSGAHRQPVSPHEQLGSLLRPGDGRAASAQGAMRGSHPPADAVLAPELKQQLRQWRPVLQAPKQQEGPRVKRALRAAEDMTVEGISAARAHAADRWRLVQPFGAADQEPQSDPAATAGGRRRAEDREPTTDQHTTDPQQADGTAVPATGLIAAAGAMRSGRRRAAREAAEDDTTPTPTPPVEPLVPTPPWATAPPAQPAAPEPQAAEPTPDTTAEVANVLDSLKAQGLLGKRRAGGRRRAPDTDDDTAAQTTSPAQPAPAAPNAPVAQNPPAAQNGAAAQNGPAVPLSDPASQSVQNFQSAQGFPAPPAPAESAPAVPAAESQPDQRPEPETPKWRVEPPQRLRSEEEPPKPANLFDAPTMVHPVVGADGHPVEHPSTGISAAFAKGPVIPTARDPRSTTPAGPNPPSGVEAPRPPEPPRSTHQSTPDTGVDQPQPGPDQQFQAGPPHIGPDFHLGADSLGRTGFRPASDPTRQPDPRSANHPPAAHPGAPAADASQNSPAAPQGQQPPTPDFMLPSDSFGRSGFRTNATPPAQPSQTWPSDPVPDFTAGFDPAGHQAGVPQHQQPGSEPTDAAPAAPPLPVLGDFPPVPDSAPRSAHDFGDGFPATAESGQPTHDFRQDTPVSDTGYDFGLHFRQGLSRPDSEGGHEAGFDATAVQSGSEADREPEERTDDSPGWAPQNWATGTPHSWNTTDATPPVPDTTHDRADLADRDRADRDFSDHAARDLADRDRADRDFALRDHADLVDRDFADRADRDFAARDRADLADRDRADRDLADRDRADRDRADQADRAAHGGHTAAELDYRSDFSRSLEHLSIPMPKPSRAPEPEPESDPVPYTPEPDQVPHVPEPSQIPPIPDPDPIPQPDPIPMPPTSSGFDLGSRFLTSADVEDDLPDAPALPRRVPAEEPLPADDPDPFVTAVVVGDRTIEVPSAARASRRHKSDLSLAELLTEALVAYETGRRSDPGAEQTASEEIADWISSAETPVSPISPDRLERAGHHVAEPGEPEPAEKVDESTASEKTTYLTPVRDLESTAPIWETGPDGEQRPPYDSWTLPES